MAENVVIIIKQPGQHEDDAQKVEVPVETPVKEVLDTLRLNWPGMLLLVSVNGKDEKPPKMVLASHSLRTGGVYEYSVKGDATATALLGSGYDMSKKVASRIFRPFTAAEFPTTLSTGEQLQSVLLGGPVDAVPVPHAKLPFYDSLWDTELSNGKRLFTAATSMEGAGRLETILATALNQDAVFGDKGSELKYTPYWDNMGFGLPEKVGLHILRLPIRVRRGVEDETITKASAKRDYYVTVGNLLCVGGEDKTDASNFGTAKTECCTKHEKAPASLYGKLGYIILTSMAADQFGVYALPIGGEKAHLVTVVEQFSVTAPGGAQKALTIFINLTRWLITVHHMRLLPPAPYLELLQPKERPSPYDELGNATTVLKLHLTLVQKTMKVPKERLPGLLKVYRMLHTGTGCPHAIQCKDDKMKVGRTVVDLKQDVTDAMLTQLTATAQSYATVVLLLQPVAARWTLGETKELRDLCDHVLQALAHAHAQRIAHRDLRADNVLHIIQGFIVIDWDVAGAEGEAVFWVPNSEHMPPVARPWLSAPATAAAAQQVPTAARASTSSAISSTAAAAGAAALATTAPAAAGQGAGAGSSSSSSSIPQVQKGDKWYCWMDLWQLGQLMQARGSSVASPSSRAFAARLLSGEFEYAGAALQAFKREKHTWVA